jgi:phosphoribosylamine--glycine ligase
LAWKISLSSSSDGVWVYPGNIGIERSGLPLLDLPPNAPFSALVSCARRCGVNFVVIGPELFLEQGYAEKLRAEGFLVFGPDSQSARLETSKVFAKHFMREAGIPTAPFEIFSRLDFLTHALRNRAQWPAVLKLDTLAAGKGVLVAKNSDEAQTFARQIFEARKDPTIIVEEFIAGVEISYIGLCDGKSFVPLESATDYKRLRDLDQGPNTGGMGALCPSPHMTQPLAQTIEDTIVRPLLDEMRARGLSYRGALFIGLMVDLSKRPFVLEFNARFGDPETQAILLRLESDWLTALELTARGELAVCEALKWQNNASAYVVAAAQGYPDDPRKGAIITDDEGSADNETRVFFAGVSSLNEQLVTSGGRVLGVGATGKDWSEARKRAYHRLSFIKWNGQQYRKDIGGHLG